MAKKPRIEIIPQSFEIVTDISTNGEKELSIIERAARACYQSEGSESAGDHSLIKKLISWGHESPLEHGSITVRIVTDRGISHELVRHRIASYSQESTRYCRYSDVLQFIEPANKEQIKLYEKAAEAYSKISKREDFPERARDVLPTALKTAIWVTANYREWRHILKLRTAPGAHPKIRWLMGSILKEFKNRIPIIFDDIEVPEFGKGAVDVR